MERNPSVLAQAHIPPLNHPTTGGKLQYLSFYFRVDNQRADVAYIFTVPKGEDIIEALMSYASRLERDNSSEYVDAFQRYVKKLHTGEILLPRSRSAQKMPKVTLDN
jgi:hypothetical protein